MVLGGRPTGQARSAAAALVCALVLGVVATLQLTGQAAAGGTSRCEQFRTGSAQRLALVTGSGAETLVIGDSWSAGLGLDDLADSWPTRLPGRVRVAGFSGSGFSHEASGCGDVSFASRAARAVTPSTDLVVVEGGLNDHDRTEAEIEAGFAALVDVLGERRVVVVGPAAAPSRAAAVVRVDGVLRDLAERAGWEYVAAYDWELGYLPDDLHLTPAGHAEFGNLVARAVSGAA